MITTTEKKKNSPVKSPQKNSGFKSNSQNVTNPINTSEKNPQLQDNIIIITPITPKEKEVDVEAVEAVEDIDVYNNIPLEMIECLTCCDPIVKYAVGKCNHRNVCSMLY